MISFLESADIKIDRTPDGALIWLSVRESSYTPGQLRALGHHLMLTADEAARDGA